MRDLLLHHLTAVVVVGYFATPAIVALVVKPLWLLLPIPAFLAGFAWFGWEYSGEAAPFAAAIAILGYGGLGTGTLLRRRLGVRERG